jgi:hypothetical protein
VTAPPEIRYSPRRMLVGPIAGGLIGVVVGLLAAGGGSLYGALVAVAALALSAVWATLVLRRLSGDPVALTRSGDQLVGTALPEPLPAHGATFAIVREQEGGWLVRLDAGGRTVSLQARTWRLPDGRRPSRAAVAETLEALGIRERP